ncbi:MAG: hypothetical protein HQ500_13470 [Flavobacteriales bacterium]|nr:hypothetical protein [Flavobacteriales bacterium]
MPESIPKAFISSLTAHFGEDTADRVLKALETATSVSIRLNPRKSAHVLPTKRRVPWAAQGYLLDSRPNYALDPCFHGGSYYVQDSSSMVLELLLNRCAPPRQGTYLDACAAPGGKSTILLDYLDGEGFLVANEVDGKRNAVLRENLMKWGHLNHGITSLSTDRFKDSDARFDVILIDAPCSGEGMFRKDAFARSQWSEELIDSCIRTQQNILQDLIPALKDDGLLIYATCTMNRKENEEQILHLLDTGTFELANPDLSDLKDFVLPALHGNAIIGHYLLPGISTGEGLFIAALKKKGSSESDPSSSIVHRLKNADQAFERTFPSLTPFALHFWEWKEENYGIQNAAYAPDVFYKRLGLPCYQIKGKDVIPMHGLAMMESNIDHLAVDHENALRYLRKESIYLPHEMPKGWYLISYEGIKLGWLKAIGTRTNNYYPNGLRLRI